MKFACLFVVVALICSAEASDVITLTDDTFESRVAEYELVLAEFYAPWCGHCKKLAPEYEVAATALKSNDPPIALVKVDCTVETKTCQKYGVSGYPTLKIFKNGELSTDYSGPRESQGIIKYMRTKAGPVVKECSTLAELEKFLANDQHSIVGFFASQDTALAKEFRKTADQLAENYRFASVLVSSAKEIADKYKYSDKVVMFQPPRLHTKLEESQQVYPGQEAISKWIKAKIQGLCGHRTQSNSEDFNRPLVIVYFNVDYTKDAKGSNYVRNRVLKVAKQLPEITFAISNTEEFRAELSEFGFENIGADKYITARDAKNQKFKYEGEYSVEALEKFAKDLSRGALESYMKSEPIPIDSKDAVKTIVARNFEQIVNDESKDVLIEFYAPWCGHCKSLAPKYEELAQKLAGEESIVIAKMDATANDVPPQYEVQGFPTLYFASKNNKQNPRKYEGGREVDDFVKYLAKESTDPLNGFDRAGKKTKKAKADL
jgi:protein disulfide isomerase family A protein 3